LTAYKELLSKIYHEGVDHADRTGKGRRSIFGVQSRYDVSGGILPVDTTRKIFTKAIITELLWFIKGSTSNKELNDNGVTIWDQWTVSKQNVEDFLKSRFPDPENEEESKARETLLNALHEEYKDDIGPMYGFMWRNAPGQHKYHMFWPLVPMDKMPSDKVSLWRSEFGGPDELTEEQEEDFFQYCNQRYRQNIDQLNELVINLKERPYSSRHVVTAWIPSHIPFENLSPQENVLLNMGCLAPCHAMFQCFVSPPKEEGGKNRLSLMMTQR
jgi:thymidylate synthase